MIRLALFFILLSLAAIGDLRTRTIPDWIPLTLAGVSLIPPGRTHLEGALVALPLLYIGVMAGGIGGGDIKLTGACGLVLGFWNTLAGLVMGLCFLLVFHAGSSVLRRMGRKERKAGKGPAYPLVPFLLLGMLFCILNGGRVCAY